MMIPQVSEKNETDWAMFGYEGQSNVIKVVSTGQRFVGRNHYEYYYDRDLLVDIIMNIIVTGDGGLEELTEDFNPSKIQYAFLKVEDPKTSLPKFVLINWQVRHSYWPLIGPW